MIRLIERLLGLEPGMLSREGAWSLEFAPRWPGGETVGHATWTIAILGLCVWWVWRSYRREKGSQRLRVGLAAVRVLLVVIVVFLLNRPSLTLEERREEPSTVAVIVDRSQSMGLIDAPMGEGVVSRLSAIQGLLEADGKLVQTMSREHALRWFSFAGASTSMSGAEDVATIRADGEVSAIGSSIQNVVGSLEGQRLAGVVILTDGRDTSASNLDTASLRDAGVKVVAIPLGSAGGVRNLAIESASVPESVFAGDLVNVSVRVRAGGLVPGEVVRVRLLDRDGEPLPAVSVTNAALGVSGAMTERTLVPDATGQGEFSVELQTSPPEPGTTEFIVEVVPVEREVDQNDNRQWVRIDVMDANVRVLYVEGYPRWEYRYLRQELIRDRSVEVSLLLTSADESFAQEGDRPIRRFPETLDELLEYDVLILGDVDPRQFTESQLQLMAEFVSRRGGGLGMIAGERHAPQAYRNTSIEPLLPVDISRTDGERSGAITRGWRPVLTAEGRASSLFRFYAEPSENERYLSERLQLLFWHLRGVTAKPGVAQVMAHHPTETGEDGRPVPIVVAGRFGAGRTLFMGIDETWRWRFYTQEQVFNSYWVQAIRYLARGRKLGERKVSLAAERMVVEPGEAVRLNLRAIDPTIAESLGESVRAVVRDAGGVTIAEVELKRQANDSETFSGGFIADRVGPLSVRVLTSDGSESTVPIEVSRPRQEFNEPTPDRATLLRWASETGGAVLEPNVAADEIAKVLPSERRVVPIRRTQPLWSSPVLFGLFVSMLVAEWVLRKWRGLV